MQKQVLWIDNDIPYLRPYRKALEDIGCAVKVIDSLSEAETLLASNRFDLVIVDVMVPTQTEEEAIRYPYEESDYGHKTGLIFYQRIKDKLPHEHPPEVVVMTVRLDQGIREEFIRSGLKPENFITKYSVREVPGFIRKIRPLLKI